MSELLTTAETEASDLAEAFLLKHPDWDYRDDLQLAKLIAQVRADAHEDALLRAADAVDACGDYWGRMQIGEAVEAIRGIKL